MSLTNEDLLAISQLLDTKHQFTSFGFHTICRLYRRI